MLQLLMVEGGLFGTWIFLLLGVREVRSGSILLLHSRVNDGLLAGLLLAV